MSPCLFCGYYDCGCFLADEPCVCCGCALLEWHDEDGWCHECEQDCAALMVHRRRDGRPFRIEVVADPHGYLNDPTYRLGATSM